MRFLWVMLLAAGLAGCNAPMAATAPAPQRVTLAIAKSGPGHARIRSTGRLVAKEEIPLSFKVAGILARFHVDQGSPVERGQLLAELELAEVDSSVRQARELAAKSDRDLARAEKLYADQVITREQVEDSRTAAAVAGAALSSAEFNAGHAAIRAPGPGVVLRRDAEPKQLVAAGFPVLTLANTDRGWVVKTSLSDREIVNVRLGDAARLRLDAFPQESLTGRVSQIARAADARTGTFDVEVTPDLGGLAPASGLIAKIEIQPGAPAPALVRVPIECLVEGDRLRAWVFAYDARRSSLRRRPVEIAFIDGPEVALRSGAAPGDRLVAAGLAYLRDGDPVEVATP